MKSEPAVILGAVTAVAVAVLAALVAFGLPIDKDQQSALLALLAAVAPIVLAIVTRGAVFAPANVAAAVTPDGDVVAGPASPIVDGRAVEVVPAL